MHNLIGSVKFVCIYSSSTFGVFNLDQITDLETSVNYYIEVHICLHVQLMKQTTIDTKVKVSPSSDIYCYLKYFTLSPECAPPYPQRDRKRRLNGAVCRNHRIKRLVPCRCWDGHVKEPCEMSMALGARP